MFFDVPEKKELAANCSFQRIARRFQAVLSLKGLLDGESAFCVARVAQQPLNHPCGSFGGVILALYDFRDAQPSYAAGIVRLIVAVGHDQHRSARAQSLCCGADAALMNDDGRPGEEPGIGRVLRDADIARYRPFWDVSRVIANQKNRTKIEGFGRRQTLFIEIACIEHCG